MKVSKCLLLTIALGNVAESVRVQFDGGNFCNIDEDNAVCQNDKGFVGKPSCCQSVRDMKDENLNTCGGSRPTGLPFAGRSAVHARRGIAATSQPLSTMCAIDILKAGGSAVDAAIAANACEGVVEPMMNGMGGDLMAQVFHGPTKTLHGYNGAGRSPQDLSYTDMESELKSMNLKYIPGEGPLGVSVPGAVKGWCDLYQKFGKIEWSKIFENAIYYASEGFPVTEVIASEWHIPANSTEMTSNGKYPSALNGFLGVFTVKDPKTGKLRPPREGEIFKNPSLAATLQKVATGGCEEFYNGSIADAYVAYASQSGLRLTKSDFANHHGEWVAPVNTTYREDYMIFELPPNPQGIAALQMLNILERYNLSEIGHNTADYLHLQVEAKKLAFADRASFYGDPDFGEPTPELVQSLISKEYAAQRASLINMTHAAKEVPHGTPQRKGVNLPKTAKGQDAPFTGDTIYLTVADSEGTMVSLIQSNYEGFGSGLVVPELGFGLQDRGCLFNMPTLSGVHTASDYQPKKRPFHTIIPGFAMKRNKTTNSWDPWMSFGVMGGNIQPQGHSQVMCNIIDFGMNPQEAGDAARYTHSGSSQPTGQIMTDGGIVQLEGGVCPAVEQDLQSRGHTTIRGANGGGYQSITYDPQTQSYQGASEMRKDGMSAGY